MKHIYKVLLGEEEHSVEIEANDTGFQVKLGDTTHHFAPLVEAAPLYSFLIDSNQVLEADVTFNKDQCELNVRNLPYQLEVFDPRRRIVSQSESAGGGGLVSAPMPGKVVDVRVAVGDQVEKGQAIVVLEAMKMQNELFAPISGEVQEVAVQAGGTVEAGQKLVQIQIQKK